MNELNKLELSILERLSVKYPNITKHIPMLQVESRESTGVGMYINFVYRGKGEDILDLGIKDSSISTNESIEMGGLKYGLGYEVDISGGRIKYIELVTYGEEWDGNVSNEFRFV